MKTYKVVGPRKVFDHAPGTTFSRKLPADQEKALVAGGHIRVVKK